MKTSKLLFTTFILLITSTVVMAQHKLYEKYVNNPNTESGYFTQDVIKAKAGKDENVSIQTEIIPYIKDVYKLSTTDLTTKKKLWKDIKRLVKEEKFEVLLQQKARRYINEFICVYEKRGRQSERITNGYGVRKRTFTICPYYRRCSVGNTSKFDVMD